MASSSTIQLVKGFRDVLPPEADAWRTFEILAARHFGRYGFSPIDLPVLERVELFARSLGDTSDVVAKEMFAFEDRDGTVVALRPEATASAVRAYLASATGPQGVPARFWYAGPMFRRERPQRGRFRQFRQIGVEVFGYAAPTTDAEVLIMLMDYLGAVGLRQPVLLLGTLGDARCRPAYRDRLQAFATPLIDGLCDDCRQRLTRNPLRLLDCKNAQCKESLAAAPRLVDHLCSECESHFRVVRTLLDDAGVTYELAPRLVRGLDYYTRTAFEVEAAGLGAQSAIGGGGRYDGLVATLGGPDVPGFGFALGIDRLAMAAGELPASARPVAVVLPLVDAATRVAVRLATRLRRDGVDVLVEPAGRSVKAMLRVAARHGGRLAILIGEDELTSGRLTIRDLEARRDHPGVLPVDVDGRTFGTWLSSLGPAQGER